MRRITLTSLAFTGTILVLAACTSRDPYYRTDVWKPTGANAANLAAMVANPYDLISGHASSAPQLSKDQIPAVDRAWSGAAIKSGSGGSPGAAPGG